MANYNEHFITRACVRASDREWVRRKDGGVGSGGGKDDGAKEDTVVAYICRWEMYVYLRTKAVERCAIDAAFFTFLDVARYFL